MSLGGRIASDDGVDVGEIATEVAALLRAGATTKQAWAQTLSQQSANSHWAQAGHQIAAGVPVDDALVELANSARFPGPLLGAAAGCRLAAELGSSAADVLDECVETVTEMQEAALERQAAVAGPKSTMRVLKALPIIALFLFQGAGVNAINALITSVFGWFCMLSGAALLLAGHRWVNRLIARAESGDL